MGLFDYPVSRDVDIPHFRIGFYMLAFIYFTVVTIINTYAVGYEPRPLNSWDFNNTEGNKLWYELFIPQAVRNNFPETWKCQPSIIRVNDGC